MASPPVTHAGPARRLQRNPRRRRLGGVCAGLADFLGVEARWVRLAALLSVFFSFSLTVWVYLALWVVLPAAPEVPMPAVSRPLRRELMRIDKLVRSAHRRLPAQLADQAQHTLDALKGVAGELDSASAISSTLEQAWSSAQRRLPGLLQGLLAGASEEASAAELRQLELSLRQASRDALERELAMTTRRAHPASGRFQAWREQLAPLLVRLGARIGPQAQAVVQRIEDKLAFLLPRVGADGGAFDLAHYDVERIAFNYLPDALGQYLDLPVEQARSVRLAEGLTAEEWLTEQLIRLDNALENVAGSVFARDAQGLLIHGRFLRERFAEQPFRLPGESPVGNNSRA